MAVAAVTAAGLLTAAPAMAEAPIAGRPAPVVPHDKSVPVFPVVSHYHRAVPERSQRVPAPDWPSGRGVARIPAAGGAGGVGAARGADAAGAAGAAVRAGSLPVWVRAGGPAAEAAPSRASSASVASAPASVAVSMAGRAVTERAGVSGVLFTTSRADRVARPGRVSLTVSYAGFRYAYGGDWASRLRLVELPRCALTTPQVAACRVETALRSVNNSVTGTVTAPVTLTSSQVVLAASSAAGGGGGDFTATSLKPSGSWQAGGSSDAFTWSYPINSPQVPGGLVPSLELGYNSQSVDGLTSSTNTQPSVVGDGWTLPESFIERSYQSCHQNPNGTTQTADNCWSSNNQLTLSLNGSTTTLIMDDTTGVYHPANDGNERVQYQTGAANGARNGEYWVITTTDGTQYFFGLNQLPGWASGDATTNSVWTEPVFATASGQPCYSATWADSWCQQAYRWNLDYVKDTHGDVISYFYGTQTGYYARNLGSTANTSYIRGGYLSKIWYGQRDGSVYSTSPAAEVTFTVNGRCDTSPTGCDASTLSSSTAKDWPDVPYDLNCASNASCSTQSPTFWSEYEVTGIATSALVGSAEMPVDSWALTYAFPATGDSTTPALWLSTITMTADDTSAGPADSPITMNPVTFNGQGLPNRVNLTEGYPPITRQRLVKITTETGEVVQVGYSSSLATSQEPSSDSANATLAYPVWWTPAGQPSPVKDYFNKYIVTAVDEQDPTGGTVSDDITTTYTPVGSPAWHYNDSPLTPSNQRTWDQWSGFGGMTVSTGTAPDPVTKTTYTYFRGMNGDTLPGNATRSVAITDSRGDPAVPDAAQYAGMTYEAQVFNGSSRVSDTISDPWSAATATHTITGVTLPSGITLPPQQAFLTGTADTRVYTALAAGGERETETEYTHDADGRVTQVNDLGDVSTSSDDLCTTTTYADNTTLWILNAPAEVKTVSVSCSATPSYPADAVSDTQTFYDGSATLGASPTAGDVTMVRKAVSYTGSTPNLITMSTDTVDEYGRVTSATDGDGRVTTTAYTPATGAEPTSVAVTDPMKFTTTTTYDPLLGLPLTVTDPAGYVTTKQYDALGQLTAVYKPGEAAADLKYSYTVSDTGPSTVDAYTLNDDGSYQLTETLYDALLRARETQQQTVDGGRLITDTYYNTDGWESQTSDPYYNSSGITPAHPILVQAQIGQVPSATGYAYDSAGRQTVVTAYALGKPTWQTTTTYGGNFTTTVPPAGGTATTTVTNARGELTDLIQYHDGQPADYLSDQPSQYDDTTYTYYPGGQQATETDPGGNTWSWTYDLLGDQLTATDPDAGTATYTYDNAGQKITSTSASGNQVTGTYDGDGRVTATYDTSSTSTLSSSNELTSYVYDTLKKGLLTSATSYSGGDVYTSAVLGYNSMALPEATKVTLTGQDAALVPSTGFTTAYAYNLTGSLHDQQDPASGGLPAETITYGYDQFGQPTTVTGSGGATWDYVAATGYSELGQPVEYTFGPSTSNVWDKMTYDPQTQRLNDIQTTDSTTPAVVDNLAYSYSSANVSGGAGLVTSVTDTQNGATADTQCFTYDYAQRLTQAWTATDNCQATPAPGNSGTVGGAIAPYWQSWTYTPAGTRLTQTDHDVTGNTANDTTTTYNYPAQGSATDQPHTLTSTTATGPGAAADTASYTYNPDGTTATITGGPLGSQSLTWNTLGQLASDQSGTGTTSYAYDTAGNLIIQRDPGQTTFYTGDEQLVLNTGTGAVSGTRYYSIGGTTIAARTSGGSVDYLIPDRQGTDQLAIDSGPVQAVTRRSYLPFGAARTTPDAAWPGDKGYVGGTTDPATSLVNLGAREYDTATGRFLSVDPIFETTSPQQLNGYDYAANNPATGSDPTGQMLCVDNGPCGGLKAILSYHPYQGGGGGGGSHYPNRDTNLGGLGGGPPGTGQQRRAWFLPMPASSTENNIIQQLLRMAERNPCNNIILCWGYNMNALTTVNTSDTTTEMPPTCMAITGFGLPDCTVNMAFKGTSKGSGGSTGNSNGEDEANLIAKIASAIAKALEEAADGSERDLYRADSRPPDEIFRDGFKPWGDNMDLVAHVTGESQDSAFVASSKTQAAAAHWAEVNGYDYVYKLRGWGVDVNETLGLTPDSQFYAEQEIAIPSSVPGSDIVGVWGPDGWQANPYYVP